MNLLPQIQLRALEPEDLEILYTIENDRSLWDIGVTNVPYSRYVLHDYLAQANNDIYADGQVRLVIEVEGGGVAGLVDLMNFDPKNLKAEIGIVVRPDYRGRGVAHAALLQVADYAHATLHVHQLYAIVAADNDSSQQLFQSVGYQNVAVLHDWLYDGDRYHDALLYQTFF